MFEMVCVMPIDDIKATDALKPYSGQSGQSGGQSSYGSFKGRHKYPPVKRTIHDVTSFMNIPQDELTPAVSEAIVSLMEEVDHLREELSMTHSFDEKLSSSMDRHMDLPVLTRHALCRDISVMTTRIGKTISSATFVYFQIANFAEIKKRAGLLAGDTVIREVAEILSGQLRETDRIGTLGGDGFGIVLTLSDFDASLVKIDHLVEQVQQGPILFDGRVMDVEIAYGLHSLHAGEKVDVILNEADKDLHKRFVRL
ncbi:GGDEF domain-containing protein [Terasakiella sp.]|uniref:GGDEF domain-containing protein n=1 Tax=Terasakiella sp. TaxID=2034861 RepID=UPI003AA906EC